MSDPVTMQELIEMDEAISTFHDDDVNLDVEFADDVPLEFIEAWKNKIRVSKEFHALLNQIKSNL